VQSFACDRHNKAGSAAALPITAFDPAVACGRPESCCFEVARAASRQPAAALWPAGFSARSSLDDCSRFRCPTPQNPPTIMAPTSCVRDLLRNLDDDDEEGPRPMTLALATPRRRAPPATAAHQLVLASGARPARYPARSPPTPSPKADAPTCAICRASHGQDCQQRTAACCSQQRTAASNEAQPATNPSQQ